jgi:predicted membrane-bound spermidine synthase
VVGRLWRVVPFAFFVISGTCGLVYEVTWGKYLALFLGNTSLAYMCILAGYMGGLALGSFIIGSASTRIRRPLALYGWLEIAIGLYAIAFPFFIHRVESLVLSQAASLGFGTPAWAGLKLAVSLAVLLLPTVLMGGTFPLLMKHYRPATARQEDKAEWLYTANCAGAVVGGMLAGFLWIPQIGMSHTLWYVGLANAILVLAAVALGMAPSRAETQAEVPGNADVATKKSRRLLRPVYVAIAVSGATSMIYELVWIRIFAIALGGTTYAFALMVSAFITGIAIGSLLVGVIPWLRRNALLAFALAEIAIGATILMSVPIYQRLPYVFWKWSSLLRPSPESMWLNSILRFCDTTSPAGHKTRESTPCTPKEQEVWTQQEQRSLPDQRPG